MIDIDQLEFPETIRYTEDHLWVLHEGERLRIGITDYAQDQMGEIVYIELPRIEKEYGKGEECAVIESVKAVSEIYMPISGIVDKINNVLEENPSLINKKPFADGWLMDIKNFNLNEIDALMNKTEYIQMLKNAK